MTTENENNAEIIELSAQIVASYVSNNSVPMAEMPALIASVHSSLAGLGSTPLAVEPEKKAPAVSVRKSLGEEFLICLEDGKKFRSLKRHLRTAYNLSPDQYRSKWNLPSDYPMVAPAYAAKRSALAKASGLGAQRRKPVLEAVKKGKKAKA